MKWVVFWLSVLALVVVLTACGGAPAYERFDQATCMPVVRGGEKTPLWICS